MSLIYKYFPFQQSMMIVSFIYNSEDTIKLWKNIVDDYLEIFPNGSTSSSDNQNIGSTRPLYYFWCAISLTLCYLLNLPCVTGNNFSISWILFINSKSGYFCSIFEVLNFFCVFMHISVCIYYIFFATIGFHILNIYFDFWTEKITCEVNQDFNDGLIHQNLKKLANVLLHVSR